MSTSRLCRQWSRRTASSCKSDSNLTGASSPSFVVALLGGWEVTGKLPTTVSVEVLPGAAVSVMEGVVVVEVFVAPGEAKLLAEGSVLNISNAHH